MTQSLCFVDLVLFFLSEKERSCVFVWKELKTPNFQYPINLIASLIRIIPIKQSVN